MTEEQNPEPDDKEQSERFIDTARSLEVDESGKPFEDALKKISKKPTQSTDKSDKAP